MTQFPPLNDEAPMKRKRVLLCKSSPICHLPLLMKEDGKSYSKFYKWSPSDDLLLKEAAERNISSALIAQTVKFSANFTRQEIEDRWHTLLHSEDVLNETQRMVDLMKMTKRAPWSKEEDEIILQQLKEYGYFDAYLVLDEFRDQLHPSRTAKTLEAHFYDLKSAGMFDGILHFHVSPTVWQGIREYYQSQLSKSEINEILSFKSPVELTDEELWQLTEAKIVESVDEEKKNLTQDAASINTKKRKRIHMDEPKRKKFVSVSQLPITSIDSILSSTEGEVLLPSQKIENQDITNIIRLENLIPKPNAFACFEGEHSIHLVTKLVSILGRSTLNHQDIDIDLSLHVPHAYKSLSRKQAQLYISTSPRDASIIFTLKNIGSQPILINGKSILKTKSIELQNDSLIVFPGDIRFRFLINESKFDEIMELLAAPSTTSNIE